MEIENGSLSQEEKKARYTVIGMVQKQDLGVNAAEKMGKQHLMRPLCLVVIDDLLRVGIDWHTRVTQELIGTKRSRSIVTKKGLDNHQLLL